MRIILADSHGPVMGKDQTSANLSLLYLGSYLRGKASFPVELKYIPQAKSDQFHLDLIRDFKPDIYAVSFTSYSALVTYELVGKIKKQFPQVFIVCGGPHAIHASKEILTKSAVDICVIGEGEETFLEIASNLDSIIEKREKIKGITYLENGKYKRTAARPLIDDIDTIPFPIRDLVDDNDFAALPQQGASQYRNGCNTWLSITMRFLRQSGFSFSTMVPILFGTAS